MSRNLLLYNGKVETMRPGAALFDSIAVKNGMIAAVGNNLDSDPEFRRLKRIDLRGAVVYPGFVDAHTHFYYYSQTLGECDLQNTASLDDALSRVKSHAKTLKRGEWLTGAGIDVRNWKAPNWPTASDLDSVTGNRPAFIFSKDYHSAWVNSAALALGGITERAPDPAGGEIVRLADGVPSGILREKSAYLPVYEKISERSAATKRRLFNEGLQIAYQRGVTGTHSFDLWNGYEFMRDLADKNKLRLRVRYNILAEDLDRARKKIRRKNLFGFGDDWIQTTGVKVFADGALGSRTAFMHKSFSSAPGDCGIEVTTKSALKRIALEAKALGLPMAVHAIGDQAITNVLETLSASPPPVGTRHRIEHLQILRKKDLALVVRSGVVASMQPSHMPSDIPIMKRHLGSRANNCYLFNSLAKRGVPLAFGSDAPIEPLDPLGGIVDAVRRQSHSGREVIALEERISALSAVRGFTAGAAFAVCQENEYGFALPGYHADLTILSSDLRKATLKSISDTSIIATIVDGKVVYSSGALDI